VFRHTWSKLHNHPISIHVPKSRNLGGYIRLSANGWSLTRQVDCDKLNKKDKENLLILFDELRSVEFPSIVEQPGNPILGKSETR
jgi:hypothetical protein